MDPLLPEGLFRYEHQVAGHGYSQSQQNNKKHVKSKPQLLHSPGERCIYKPVQAPPKGDREIRFYQEVFSEPSPSNGFLGYGGSLGDGDWAAAAVGLRRFLPAFAGVYRSSDCPGLRYIRLEDLLHDFVRPSVMDLKIGAKSYEPDAPERKRTIELAKYRHREAVGFLVTGLRAWREESQQYEYTEKQLWAEVTPENVHSRVVPQLLLSVPAGPHRRRALEQLLAQLECLRRWFESQAVFHFYASSILLAVESCPAALDDASLPPSLRDDSPSPVLPEDDTPPPLTRLPSPGGDSSSPPQLPQPAVTHDLSLAAACDEPAPADDASTTGSSSFTGSSRPVALVAMVDFTHVVPGNGSRDENYLVGLRSLIDLMRECQEQLPGCAV